MIEIVTKPKVRVKAGRELIVKGEGEFRPGPYYLPITNGWLSAEAGGSMNWWQQGHNVNPLGSRTALVEACISAYSQTVATCTPDHWLANSNGGRTRVTNSALARIMKRPNGYQTISDFLLNLVHHLYSTGNAYAVAFRNNRYEITELHLVNPHGSSPLIINGEIFYAVSGNVVLDSMVEYPETIVPQRDMLHLRLNTADYNPLRGISPISSAAMDIAAGNAMLQQQLSFYMNQARPSMILSTDLVLDKTQVQQLRDRWDDQSRGLNVGKTPILTAGLKPVMMSQNAVDSQLAEIMKMSEQHIALAFRVPMQILGIGNSTASSTEALMRDWLASSLGFCLGHIEEAFGKTFGLAGYPDEYLELNTSALLRSAQKDRIESLARAVQGGILSPDEARASEGYPKVPGGFGDEPRVQQQVVPLSAAGAIPAAPPAPPAPAAAKPAGPAAAKDFSDVVRNRIRSRYRSSHERQCSSA